MTDKIEINYSKFQKFNKHYSENKNTLRYGQAFYNFFDLHELENQNNQEVLQELFYCKDKNRATEIINELFDFQYYC